MKKVEMFFDYNCPYCLKGFEQLVSFMKDNPEIEVIWHPCEISVYKTQFDSVHNDVSLQGMFFAADNGVDLWQYHTKVYDLIFKRKTYNKDINAFASDFEGFLDVDALRRALQSGKYVERLKNANHYAFKETGVNVVPTYRADGGCLQDRQEFFKMGYSDTAYSGTK